MNRLASKEAGKQVRQGRLEVAGAVLEAAAAYPNRAPTRIMGGTGAAYRFLFLILDAGLVEYVGGKKRWNNRLRITDKGRDFLRHYRVLEELFPK
jgi:predicted transcriptional regulator